MLDEATSALDTESESLVQSALQNLMTGRTVFVIAHRLSTVRRADRILVLENGMIVDEGNHERLMAHTGTYRRLYDLQFEDVEAASGRVIPNMTMRSMTGYAQVKAHVGDELTFTLSLKSVNHRFLDLHLRIPSELDPVEMKIRRILKERLHRGHIEVTLAWSVRQARLLL